MKTFNWGLILAFALICRVTTYSQTPTNFEIVDSLLNESVKDIVNDVKENKSYLFKFYGSNDYSVLEERLKFHLRNRGVILSEEDNTTDRILYTLSEVMTTYPKLFQDGLFGNYLVERLISINTSYYIDEKENVSEQKEVFIVSRDSVLYSEFSQIENIAYPFTSSELPEEPLFSSTLEPIIAIGTAAVAVYLFFNIRSK